MISKYQTAKLYMLLKKTIAIMLSVVIVVLLCPHYQSSAIAADQQDAENVTLYVDGNKNTVKVLNQYYDNNRYVSVRDVASALIGTPKKFEVSIGNNSVHITLGEDYVSPTGAVQPFSESVMGIETDYRLTLKYNSVYKNGQEVKYCTIIGVMENGYYDCFMDAVDMAMCFDLNMWMEGEEYYIDTTSDFNIDINRVIKDGYFDTVGGVLCGDATTGEIFYSSNGTRSIAMASTTKLMTYILVMDAVSAGKIDLTAPVYVSDTVSRLSYDTDGVIRMKVGQKTNVQDLLYAILLPSSNESAKMLAEVVAGSEEAFVEKMNEKAREIGMTQGTIFYNSHGLPCYIDSLTATKNQNHTTPEDMFKLVQYLMKYYPQVTDITSKKSISIESLGVTVQNTNPLLTNMQGMVGLKTGTTNRAGSCLVAAMKVEADDGIHYLISIEYGAETSYTRTTMSELLLRYALQCYKGIESESHESGMEEESSLDTSEKLIRYILDTTHVNNVPDEPDPEIPDAEGVWT